MVQILEANEAANPNFLKSLVGTLGQTLPSYIDKFVDTKRQQEAMGQENQALKKLTGQNFAGIQDPKIRAALSQEMVKNQQKQQLLESLFGENNQPSAEASDALLESGMPSQPGIPNKPFSTKQIVGSAMVDKGISDVLSKLNEETFREKRYQEDLRQRKEDIELKKEGEYFKFNEPKVAELYEKLENYEQSGLGFDRMQFLTDTEGKSFPSSFTAAMLDLDSEGGLSSVARSQLSPAAQEYVKLIVNQLRDAKGTFGARLTNLDVSTYLKGLPSLMNTPEGRNRILHQLRTLNKINQMYNQGIISEFENAGGTNKIPFSTAAARARKTLKPEMDELKELFVNPNKDTFQVLPDPSLQKGVLVEDPETGKRFRSNGKEWVEQ